MKQLPMHLKTTFVVLVGILKIATNIQAQQTTLETANQKTKQLRFGSPQDIAGLLPAVQGAPVAYFRTKPERARPDPFDSNDGFRKRLLAPSHSDRYSVPTADGNVLLVVEKGYLDAADLQRIAADIQEAVREVPKFVQRSSLIKGRFTVYIYDNGPLSESGVPGARQGEKGLMLRFVKEDKAPVFHELTHMLAGYSDSQSLAEGVADYVENHFRPGKAHAFVPAGLDPHVAARAAVKMYSPAFLAAIGSPGYVYRGSDQEERFNFYYASWSFVDYLASSGDMQTLWSVIDAGATQESYQKAYGHTFEFLKQDWLEKIARR